MQKPNRNQRDIRIGERIVVNLASAAQHGGSSQQPARFAGNDRPLNPGRAAVLRQIQQVYPSNWGAINVGGYALRPSNTITIQLDGVADLANIFEHQLVKLAGTT